MWTGRMEQRPLADMHITWRAIRTRSTAAASTTHHHRPWWNCRRRSTAAANPKDCDRRRNVFSVRERPICATCPTASTWITILHLRLLLFRLLLFRPTQKVHSTTTTLRCGAATRSRKKELAKLLVFSISRYISISNVNVVVLSSTFRLFSIPRSKFCNIFDSKVEIWFINVKILYCKVKIWVI